MLSPSLFSKNWENHSCLRAPSVRCSFEEGSQVPNGEIFLFNHFRPAPSYPASVWIANWCQFQNVSDKIFWLQSVSPIASLLSQQALNNNEPLNTRFVSLLQASQYYNTISQHWLICFMKANGEDSGICLFGCTNLLHSLTYLLQKSQLLLISWLPFGWEAARYICKILAFHQRYPVCLWKGNNVKWSLLFSTNLLHIIPELNVAQNVNSEPLSVGCPCSFHLEVIIWKYMPPLPRTGDPASA